MTVTQVDFYRQAWEAAEKQLRDYAQRVKLLTTCLASGVFTSTVLDNGVYQHWLSEVREHTLLHLMPPVPQPPPPAPDQLLGTAEEINAAQHSDSSADGLYLAGRGFSVPVYTVTILAGRVVIRVEDSGRTFNWIELGITEELIEQWSRAFALAEFDESDEKGQFDQMPDDGPDPV